MPLHNESHPSYSLELLTSAGPRKQPDAYRREASLRELGEDAGGVLFLPGGALFWVADGTSQEARLSAFSSRMLAQDLGVCLQRCATERHERDGAVELIDLLPGMFAALETLWQKRLIRCWHALESDEARQRFLERFPVCGDGLRRLSWSSTFLAGLLAFDACHLETMNLGDAGGIVYSESSAAPGFIFPGNKRFFVSIDFLPEAVAPFITSIDIDWTDVPLQTFDDVTGFLCLTDGNTPASVSRFLSMLETKPFFRLERMLRVMRVLSWDDRTLLIGRRSSPHDTAEPFPPDPCA